MQEPHQNVNNNHDPLWLNHSRDQLHHILNQYGATPFRNKQLWHHVYFRGAQDFSAINNMPKPLLAQLTKDYQLNRPAISTHQQSKDGTQKWLLKLADNNEVEMVYIPESDRGTLCISSQVGCTLSCTFCHTGTQPLVRNLTCGEIVGQVLLAKDQLDDWPISKPGRRVTNIVFMGMGEPLLNYDAVTKATHILLDPDGLNFSKRKITLSTSGIVPNIIRCGEDLGIGLAISLHAVNDTLRDEIVPINRKYPLETLLEACKNYKPTKQNNRRITFEYVMLKGVNDQLSDAKKLTQILKDIPAKINLIPFNKWPGSPYQCSDAVQIGKFARILTDAGYTSPIRMPRGEDILAACGQLKSLSIHKRRK